MELILGMRPMTHFDAGAAPMFAAFAKEAGAGAVGGGETAHPARPAESG